MTNFQIGKNGFTENFIDAIRKTFKNRDTVKISVLRSFSRNREEVNEIALKLCSELGKNYTYKIIGFTIIIKKWRKAR